MQKKKKGDNGTNVYQIFSSFSAATERAKEENSDGASEEKTGGSLERGGIVGEVKNGGS